MQKQRLKADKLEFINEALQLKNESLLEEIATCSQVCYSGKHHTPL